MRMKGCAARRVPFLLALGSQPAVLERGWLGGNDLALRQETVDALFAVIEARSALTLEWIDSRLKSGAREDLLVAARALGAMTGSARCGDANPADEPDVEVRRMAYFPRRPAEPELLDVLLPSFFLQSLATKRAVPCGVRRPAVPDLKRLLDGRARRPGPRRSPLGPSRASQPRAVGPS